MFRLCFPSPSSCLFPLQASSAYTTFIRHKSGRISASEVPIVCGFNPFQDPSTKVIPMWKKMDSGNFLRVVNFLEERDLLAEDKEERIERQAQSTYLSHQITSLALEETKNADTTQVVQQATQKMRDELEKVDEPSKQDKQNVVEHFAQDFGTLKGEVDYELEHSHMSEEKKATAKTEVQEQVQSTIEEIGKNMESLSSTAPEYQAEFQKSIRQTLDTKQHMLTDFLEAECSSPLQEEREKIAHRVADVFQKVRDRLQGEVAGLKPALTPQAKEEIANQYQSTIYKQFGTNHEGVALDAYEVSAKKPVHKRNDEYYSRWIGKTKGDRHFFLSGKVDGLTEDGTVVEVKNRLTEFKDPLPAYDIVQLWTYLYILKSTKGQLVEQLKYDTAQHRSTLVEWDAKKWQEEIRPRLARFCNAMEDFMQDDLVQMKFLKANDEAKAAIFSDLLRKASPYFPYSPYKAHQKRKEKLK